MTASPADRNGQLTAESLDRLLKQSDADFAVFVDEISEHVNNMRRAVGLPPLDVHGMVRARQERVRATLSATSS